MLARPTPTALLFVLPYLPAASLAAPILRQEGNRMVVEGAAYRVTFMAESLDMLLDLKAADGQWLPVTNPRTAPTFAYIGRGLLDQSNGARATSAMEQTTEAVILGRQAVLDLFKGIVIETHFICADEGLLIGARLIGRLPAEGALWSPPRIILTPGPGAWDGYAFWAADGGLHQGRLADLQPSPAYAGVSAWEQQGDVVPRLDPQHPALIVQSASRGTGLGVVFLDYADSWAGCHSFLQRHTPHVMYLYAGYGPPSEAVRWAWLAPFAAADAAQVTRLVNRGAALLSSFRPIAPPVPSHWAGALPDFPAQLRRPQPVRDINEAVVFSINELINTDYGIDLARKAGSDVLIRAWFKWGDAPPVADWSHLPSRAHELGALFGGGITCSALYDTENGITREQLLDMATRGPAGQLIDAWDMPGVRHGSLSSPAYLDYLFRWCREQIDAGVDYLFMDEHTAAITGLEGYDDHSLRDFRQYLLTACPYTQGWALDDPRWRTKLRIPLHDPQVCPTGKMDSFDYRAYMRVHNLLDNPYVVAQNPLLELWWQFTPWRDDRAWKTLTDRIRAYAQERGRTVLISANGIAKYVDLQVLGVWGQWTTDNGHIDLRDNQLPYWRSLVLGGCDMAGKRVPVVLFHDWGCGDPPFPWMAVPFSEQEVWMRTRGAEIYAAGAFFAFPVMGPVGCDAGRNGTLATIQHLAAFYQTHRNLFLRSRWLGYESLRADVDRISLAAWWNEEARAVVLHVINRDVREGVLQPREALTVTLPVSAQPQRVSVLSPDFAGERQALAQLADDGLGVTIPGLEAYSIVLLHYPHGVDLSRLADPFRIRPDPRWARPPRNQFPVLSDGSVQDAADLTGFLQGMLHTHLRKSPTFLVNALGEVELQVHARAVAAAGANLVFSLDGQVVKTVDLPDLDGKNDSNAPEYDRTFTLTIPPGRHRVTLDNTGGDWVLISWYAFLGKLADW